MPVHRSLDGDVLTLSFDGEYSFLEIAEAARAGPSSNQATRWSLRWPRDKTTFPHSRPPRAARHEFTHGKPRLTAHASQGDRPFGGYTVLVVDDEEAVRRLAVRMLTWTGYQAIEARHGREALAAIEQHNGPVHLVLTDIKMPGMNGRELGRHVEERWPGKPILYMSGFASEVFQGGLLEPGAPFLAKPFTQEDLAAKVRGLLETKPVDSRANNSAAAP